MFTVDDIVKATGGKVLSDNSTKELLLSGASIDSRTLKTHELFVPLKGNNVDGHDFIETALGKACCCLCSRGGVKPPKGTVVVFVEDTLKALQSLGAYVRASKKIPVIAITGTNGKTTTKELLYKVLSTGYNVFKTMGNFNNHIGLPLSLSKLNDESAAVLEMGASVAGDIELLCNIARPDIGIVTNLGAGHLEGFGDMETLRKTKLELMDFASTMIVNGDDNYLMEEVIRKNNTLKRELLTYGFGSHCAMRAENVESLTDGTGFSARVVFPDGDIKALITNIAGVFNVHNALSALSAGFKLGLNKDDMTEAVSEFSGVPLRLEIERRDGMLLIKDLYNSNPASTKAAVEELCRLKSGRTVAVLGDMLELGAESEKFHRELGQLLSLKGIDVFIAVGKLMGLASDEYQKGESSGAAYKADNAKAAAEILNTVVAQGDTVLIKGSRALKMEGVIN
ncbi:MAG: UDP-N-acetylmuramoyl-tripeptide--D-alanyl-D-alanine ligase [Nitrospirae bacterium]|nr:UDP-N-acetylmuramoyl-tripeptide--D-alanyl-D-alanine ligase [Nitrospirota bacterium]MBF0534214.1 UDP-N-acetylmuramoyl-tripeptide--D-alanyl-D-alanine ligase [Nitrospirota bacterium]MBF0615872.1 UDP-N-acetylmuramoyl-tripeptide--D-alanyl-D-alanine ligase [Nitrospirota bacterium]